MTKVKFTGKVGAKHMNFMKEGCKELHSAYYTTVETTCGQKLTVKDTDAPFGLMEAPTRSEAVKKGKQFLAKVGLEDE
ncbi:MULTISPECIES: hypothetical protein [Bacillus]|uniref:hypothetical protein n=1 Tax=Bacillus TaxID=1386 RepID=UPI0013D50409|nr:MULTISPECIES: hypothetical protein [Bacillus]MCX2773112.1 hypothetical protein [Bacillus sp. H2FL2]MDL5023772.1 hypothetical protein [Bacillus velezensis]